ncbi:CPP1-like family protein [Geitlerinema sp. PCC 9228]|jgi:hypothetical protein|uniref:CPP1-like family protein n=1 Tax=Geitlerinema sp. PCC 9228 TaxID=111611 RepID=UPI0008F984B9|nr:CPP1-like family protein [Geitlerinema sp. PCC 9228]
MSDLSHYEQLGVPEDASFDEIQAAKARLVEQYKDDRARLESIEAAYDAILMERLRMRQEGKIKVPERIRFAEDKAPAAPPKLNVNPPQKRPEWLERFLDQPDKPFLLRSSAAFAVLAAIGVLASPSLALALGFGGTLYLLNSKEKRFGRSVLLSLGGLAVGLLLGSALEALLPLTLPSGVQPEAVASVVTLGMLWLTSNYIR